MIDLKITSNIKEFLLALPIKLELKPDVRTDVTEIVRKDIEKNLDTGRDISGGLVARLSSRTIKIKGHAKPFYRTGELLKSVEKITSTKSAEIFIKSGRSKIAEYLNYGTNRIPARQFFGVSKNSELEVDKYLLSKKFEDLFKNRFQS